MEKDIAQLTAALADHQFVADEALATALVLMNRLSRPLLIEGEPGVGKTAIASSLAKSRSTDLIRIQCYEGIDATSALYEWNYTRQLLAIKLGEQQGANLDESDIYNEDYLLERPLLKSIRQPVSPVLLIDEIDRADEAFEAFLLEVLSEFSVSIPEIGTIHATTVPFIILTSNGTRELSDALRRRCLYHYASYPSYEKELAILYSHLPEINHTLGKQIIRFVQALRNWELLKRPGIAETLDWAAALSGLGLTSLIAQSGILNTTMSCLLKTKEDTETMTGAAMITLLNELAVTAPPEMRQ